MKLPLSAASVIVQLMQRARNCGCAENNCSHLCVNRLAYKSILFSKALDGLFRFSGSNCKELKKNGVTDIEFLDGSSVKVLINTKGEVEDIICEKSESTKEVTRYEEKGNLFLYYYFDCEKTLNRGDLCRSQVEKGFFYKIKNSSENRRGV